MCRGKLPGTSLLFVNSASNTASGFIDFHRIIKFFNRTLVFDRVAEIGKIRQILQLPEHTDIFNFIIIPESVKFMIFDNQLAYCKLV